MNNKKLVANVAIFVLSILSTAFFTLGLLVALGTSNQGIDQWALVSAPAILVLFSAYYLIKSILVIRKYQKAKNEAKAKKLIEKAKELTSEKEVKAVIENTEK